MPELRKDPIVGRWVIISTERARRPGNFVEAMDNTSEARDCPFCHDASPDVYVHKKDSSSNWQARVVKSGTPILKEEGNLQLRGHGLYDVGNGLGAHEVVIESPRHIANMADMEAGDIQAVFETYRRRIEHHKKNPAFKYVLAYKNHGVAAGSRKIGHVRSQIMAIPVNPIRVQDKLAGAQHYFDYHDRCIFCDLIEQEKRFGQRVVLENDHCIAVTPFASRFPFEIWILPKRHHHDFAEGVAGMEGALAGMMGELLRKIKTGLNDPAYNYIIQTAPFLLGKSSNGRDTTIEQDYHWHIELIPRLTQVAGFEKGTGFYICSIPPEKTAEFLRGVKI